MNLINSSFEILEPVPGIQGVKKQIERAGRTCYKSEDKITEDSCEEFVNRMINSGHGAMLEHGTVYLYLPVDDNNFSELVEKYTKNKYTKVNQKQFVTTNYRVLVENEWLDDLQYLCEPTEYHEKRIAVRVICDRGVSHEFVRHRTMSFAQESTRYCNYSKDKFGNEITCILPSWELDGSYLDFEEDLKVIESIYFKWLKRGWKAQEARYFLPTGVKTELVMTGFVSDWEHFCSLRTAVFAHPQARELATGVQSEFKIRGFFKN